MSMQTPTGTIRTRQYARMLKALSDSVEEKSVAGNQAPHSCTSNRNVQLSPAEDAKPIPSGMYSVEDRSDTTLDTPVLVSPTGTSSTASSPGIADDIWDSPVPPNHYLSGTRRNNALTPLTPPSVHGVSLDYTPVPKARKALLPKSVEDGAERDEAATLKVDHGAETKPCIDSAQNEDYFFKPQKLIRNLTKELKAIADANTFPDQPRYNSRPDFNFEEAARFHTSARPRLPMIATRYEAKSDESKSDIKVECTTATKEPNNDRPPLIRKSSKPLHPELEHIIPMEIQSRVIENQGKCVATKVGKPHERCSSNGPGCSIEQITEEISKCNIESNPLEFIEHIERLIRATMCGRHRKVALSSKRQEKLRTSVIRFAHVSHAERSHFQTWVDSIAPGGPPVKLEARTVHIHREIARSADNEAPEAQAIPAVPLVTALRHTLNTTSTVCLPGFVAFQPKRTQKMSVAEALQEEIIKPLKTSAQKDGFIYVFWEEAQFGMVKIGRTNNLERRLKEWNRDCQLTLKYHPASQRGELAEIPHVNRIERLIHIELKEHRRQRYCQRCEKRHQEWFEVNEPLVTKVFNKWRNWIMQKPYAFDTITREWVLRPDMMDSLAQVCEPLGLDKKPPPSRHVKGLKGAKSKKNKAKRRTF
ncbi:T5orf172 domain-containing protein [Paraphoma chrysanthemicola]|uniref:T5orf172 domain-containing protein n=1 Tax=Paraphoma chrysanthemicola TaxID=798071 RepID=A0A8K0RBC3_9PLEO|nr:T5orf172 domain-containing protein [Paraphoma chrysanthemicola]